MRLIDALLVSAIAHAGMLALPSGELSLAIQKAHAPRTGRLTAELRNKPKAEKVVAVLDVEREQHPAPTEASAEDPPASDHAATGLGLPLPHYYGPQEVSERARPAESIDLEPPELRGIPGRGKLILILWINEDGKVDRVETESSQIADTMAKVISEQFRRATFTPAQLDGKAVKSRMKIEVVVRPPSAYVVPPPRRSKPASATGN